MDVINLILNNYKNFFLYIKASFNILFPSREKRMPLFLSVMWISCRIPGASEKTRGEEFQAANINLREDAQRSWLHGFLSNIPSYPAISASTIPGKAPIRARKPKSGSREGIITWARSMSRSALDLAPSNARGLFLYALSLCLRIVSVWHFE